MATFFLRIRTRFPYRLNKISWELPVWAQNKYAVACRGGLWREILVKNGIINFENAWLAKHFVL